MLGTWLRNRGNFLGEYKLCWSRRTGANQFHSRCDGKANTISIFQDGAGTVFGGFTNIPWRTRKYMFNADATKPTYTKLALNRTEHSKSARDDSSCDKRAHDKSACNKNARDKSVCDKM